MPITVQDIYKQKLEIASHPFQPKEAYNRLLISRGYYASFLYARSLFDRNSTNQINLITHKPNGEPYSSHEKYYESLIRSGNENLMRIGKELKKYHVLRKQSDYKLTHHIRDYELMYAEQYFNECKARISFFLKNGLVPYP